MPRTPSLSMTIVSTSIDFIGEPARTAWQAEIPHDAFLYRQRHRFEIMFGRLKDWRRIAMRYDRCAHTFFAAITIAATVTFWLNQ